MTHADAMKRLRGCRELQPDAMQVIVAAEIVDALLSEPEACERCDGKATLDLSYLKENPL